MRLSRIQGTCGNSLEKTEQGLCPWRNDLDSLAEELAMSQRVAGSQHQRDNHTGTCTNTTTAFKPGPSKKPGEGSKPRAFSPALKRRKSKPKPRTNEQSERQEAGDTESSSQHLD
jgi:hypothetical protein